jgi:hypothetical protein
MFPPRWNFQPEHSHKTQTFYEFILVDTNFVLLTHNKCRWDSSRTAFSKCVIKNVITPLQWRGLLWDQRKFSQPFSPPSYNYYDYQNAWYNAFYFQNDRFQHSWFFYFEKHLEIQNLPAWFHHWWSHFGPEQSILPLRRIDEKSKEQVERVYSKEQIYFPFSLIHIYENFQVPPVFYNLPKLLVFYARYSLPWIMGWDFAFSSSSPKFLVRQIYVRWWEKCIVDTSEYPKMISDYNLLDPQTKTPFILHSPHKSDPQTKSPSKPHNPHKSKKELKKQLQDALSQISDDFDDDQEVRVAMAQNPHLFQDSQDPYGY